MKINNLSEREQLVADLMWTADSPEELKLRVSCLPREDQQRALALTQLFLMGGDEVESLDLARDLLSKFTLENG
jgi:hypothetical protein